MSHSPPSPSTTKSALNIITVRRRRRRGRFFSLLVLYHLVLAALISILRTSMMMRSTTAFSLIVGVPGRTRRICAKTTTARTTIPVGVSSYKNNNHHHHHWSKRTPSQQQKLRQQTALYFSTVPTVVDAAGSSNITQQQQQEQLTVPSSSGAVLPPQHMVRQWLDVMLPEGRCVGVQALQGDESFVLPTTTPPLNVDNNDVSLGNTNHAQHHHSHHHHWMEACFHPDEIRYGSTLKQSRTSFWLGRLALRLALNFPNYPILRDSFGRPKLLFQEEHRNGDCNNQNSCRLVGSISHKQDRGVALVSSIVSSTDDDENKGLVLAGVGVDLEMTSRPDGKPSIAKRVLTEWEQNSLGHLPGISAEEEVLLRFSLKEAIYKAAHPVLCQYVGFQEAEVTPLADGTATCRWILSNGVDQRIAKLTAHWYRLPLRANDETKRTNLLSSDDDDDFFLTTASVFVTESIT